MAADAERGPLDVCSMCSDYDPKSDAASTFYQQMQAKLFYALVSNTPAGHVVANADCRQSEHGSANLEGGAPDPIRRHGRQELPGRRRSQRAEWGDVDPLGRVPGPGGRRTAHDHGRVRHAFGSQLKLLGRAVLKKPIPPPHSEAAKAHAMLEQGHVTRGRLVLAIRQDEEATA